MMMMVLPPPTIITSEVFAKTKTATAAAARKTTATSKDGQNFAHPFLPTSPHLHHLNTLADIFTTIRDVMLH